MSGVSERGLGCKNGNLVVVAVGPAFVVTPATGDLGVVVIKGGLEADTAVKGLRAWECVGAKHKKLDAIETIKHG